MRDQEEPCKQIQDVTSLSRCIRRFGSLGSHPGRRRGTAARALRDRAGGRAGRIDRRFGLSFRRGGESGMAKGKGTWREPPRAIRCGRTRNTGHVGTSETVTLTRDRVRRTSIGPTLATFHLKRLLRPLVNVPAAPFQNKDRTSFAYELRSQIRAFYQS